MSLLRDGNPTWPINTNDPDTKREIEELAYRICVPLHVRRGLAPAAHRCVGTSVCNTEWLGKRCEMCLNAARLCIQDLVPRVAEELGKRVQGVIGLNLLNCPFPPPWR